VPAGPLRLPGLLDVALARKIPRPISATPSRRSLRKRSVSGASSSPISVFPGEALHPRRRPRAGQYDERSHLDGLQPVFPARARPPIRSRFSGRTSKPSTTSWRSMAIPPGEAVEASAGVPGSVVDWETYLAWHYNHGGVLVGVNTGAGKNFRTAPVGQRLRQGSPRGLSQVPHGTTAGRRRHLHG